MKPYVPLLLVLMLVSVSFVGISYKVEKSSTISLDEKTLYVGGSGPSNYTKIQDAIDNASNGDTVFVYNGTYVENVVVDKSVNLFGEKKQNTVIDADDYGIVVNITSDLVNVSGFTIRGSSYDNAGIEIYSKYNTIIDNNIINNSRGINLQLPLYNTIINNSISFNGIGGIGAPSKLTCIGNQIIDNNINSNNNCGIFLKNAYYNNITDNNITSNGIDGIQMSGGDNNIIRNTISNNDDDGIDFYSDYGRNYILDNIIEKNGDYGIELIGSINTINGNMISLNNWDGIEIYGSNNTIIGNTIRLNEFNGIFISDSHNYISKNVIENNKKMGICIPSLNKKSENIIDFNLIYNNSCGIFLRGGGNKITYNTFKNNRIEAFFMGYTNNWDGNYWNKKRFFPKPIFGTIGLNFPMIQFDWHPAKEPYDIGV